MTPQILSVIVFFTFIAGFLFALWLSSKSTDKLLKIYRESSEESMKEANRSLTTAKETMVLLQKYKSVYFALRDGLKHRGIEVDVEFCDGSTINDLEDEWPDEI